MSTNRSLYSTMSELFGTVPQNGFSNSYATVPTTSSRNALIGWEAAIAAPAVPGLGLAVSPLTGSARVSTLGSMWAASTPNLVPVAQPCLSQWAYVRERFNQLIDGIGISPEEITEGMNKAMRVVGSLNRAYYGHSSDTANGFLLGSWAKQTRVRPFSDLDLLFVLPWSEYWRFEKHISNKQTNLLQDVRANLGVTYPRTEIWGDRHIVAVDVDGVLIEVVPAFALDNGQFYVCDTKDSGRYKLADPVAELQALQTATAANENARQLTRMLKKWQLHNDAPIKAFQLERLAIDFLAQWPYRMNDRFWYDWMVRDFFLYMIGRAGGWVCMPGTGEWIELGSDWLRAARVAHLNAAIACIHERSNLETEAGKAWREIFGNAVPVRVS